MTSDSSSASGQRAIRVVIADDHPAMRYVLARRLQAVVDACIEVVAQVPDGAAAVLAVEHLQPHVVILDLNMPNLSGIEAAREIARRTPSATIFGWTTADDEWTRQSMLRAGAKQVFIKGEAFDSMILAILQVADRDDPEPSTGAA